MIASRRQFLRGLATALSAPVIVKAASLMPVKVMPEVLRAGYLPWSFPLPPIKTEGAPFIPYDGTAMRDLLMPGLRKITGDYQSISSQWEKVFAAQPD